VTDLAHLEVAARAPLVMAPSTSCRQKIRPGEVLRVVDRRDPLIGYHMACARCGYRAAYSARETTYIEERVLASQPFPRRLVAIENPPHCYGCHHLIAIRDGDLVALTPPAVTAARASATAAGSLAAAVAAVAKLGQGRGPLRP
jgi:hypothetical protein